MVYGLDEGILAAVDVETGKRLWKGGRYGHGQLLLAETEAGEARLLIVSERGHLVQVRATPKKHDELHDIKILNGKTWNHPAISNGWLLMRNAIEMVAFDLSLPGPVSGG